MADVASQAKMKALAEYFRNGGRAGMNTKSFNPDGTPSDGTLSAAGPAGLPPVQDVPVWALHDVSAPAGHQGAGTMDEMAAVRAAQLAQNNLASQPPEAEPDLSGYAPYPGPLPRKAVEQTLRHQANQDDAETAAPRFGNIRDKLQGPQEVTPELERQLGYHSDEEDEDKK